MLLQQKQYEDDNGNPVASDKISFVGTFVYIADGFFTWSCGHCRKEQSSRAHKINGTVHRCPDCGASSLLLRSDCENVNTLIQRINSYKDELDKQKRKIDSAVESQANLEKMHEALLKEAQSV
jgi:transcription elongation factor Elf1